MGNVCAGAAVGKSVNTPRDPADKELDEVEMREIKIPDFDAFFEQAAEPLNKIVEIHNSISQSEENLQAAAAAIQGEAQVRLAVSPSGRVDLDFWKFDDKDNEYVFTQAEVEATISDNQALRDAYECTDRAVGSLNSAIEKPANLAPTQFIEKRGRLFIERKGSQDAFIRDVNISVFSLRKQLALAAGVNGLKEGVVIFVKELAKVQEVGPLSADTDENGAIVVMCGDQELDLRKLNDLSKPVQQLRDALLELLENVQTAATSVPVLAEQSAAFAEEAQTFSGRVTDAVSESDLGIADKAKAIHATSVNTKALASGPKIVKATTVMIKYAGTELKQAMSIPLGG